MQAEAPQLPPAMLAPLPGQRSQAWVEMLAATECPSLTARRARRAERSGAPQDPIVWTRARGVNVWDADGNRFVDMSAGFGAAAIGHGAPEVVNAVQAQSERMLHALGDLHPSDVKIQLLERLRGLAPFADARVILGLSGADAVAAALKTAALHTGRPGVLAFEGAYHGLEYGALAACGYSAQFRAPFSAQLNPHVRFAPYPGDEATLDASLLAVERALDAHAQELGAVLVEPVLGRGGIVVPAPGFLTALSASCAQRRLLLIVDEVLTGLGRAGDMLCSVAAGARPDLICIGKALGGGLPVSACIGRAEVLAAWGTPGREALHTGTFFGNPLGCAAALAALDVIDQRALCHRSRHLGAWLKSELSRIAHAVGPKVRAVRGEGLMIGVELDSGARALGAMRALLEQGYITVPARADASVISLTPPLTITRPLLEGFLDLLGRTLREGTA